MLKYGVFPRIRTEYGDLQSKSYFPVFSLNMGKYRPEKTPYLDTFHAVIDSLILDSGICKIWIFEKSSNLLKTDAWRTGLLSIHFIRNIFLRAFPRRIRGISGTLTNI